MVRGYTKEELVEQVKAVGQSIIDDAEYIVLEPHNLTSIEIYAEIAPRDQITSAVYKLTRISDSRRTAAQGKMQKT